VPQPQKAKPKKEVEGEFKKESVQGMSKVRT